MKIGLLAFSEVDVDDARLDQLVDDPTDIDAVRNVLQRMVDAGDRSVIAGWDRLADLQIDEVTL